MQLLKPAWLTQKGWYIFVSCVMLQIVIKCDQNQKFSVHTGGGGGGGCPKTKQERTGRGRES